MRFGIVLNSQNPPRGDNIAQTYAEALREAETAEKNGFELAVFGENHGNPDGYQPCGLTFAAAVAARTNTLHVATDVMPLPVWHPLHVAEIGALVDNLSGGRLAVGVGFGNPDRVRFGVPKKGVARRFDESIEILRRAWGNETFSFSGEHFNFENVRVSPRPFQKGGPPIWIAGLSDPGLARTAKFGDGWPTDNLQKIDTMKDWVGRYRAMSAEHGRQGHVLFARSAWVAESRKEVESTWWPILRTFFQHHIKMGLFRDLPEGDDGSTWTFDGLAPDRLVAGTPDDVIASIERYRAEINPETMIFMFRHPAGPTHEETMRCIELFGKEVIPHFKGS